MTLSVFTPAEHRLLAACRERAEGVGDLEPSDAPVRNLRRALETRWGVLLHDGALAPSKLGAPSALPDVPLLLGDGDTLCCTCPVFDAQCGLCLRQWFSPFLVRAGWRVIRDGQEVRL